MADVKTVDGTMRVSDPLISKQREDVAKMRTSLLALSAEPETAVQSMQTITVLRVYHQIARIIRYLDLMDKLEEKLYNSIEHAIDNMKEEDQSTWMMLLQIQERLQKNMLDSHKLLQPYLSVEEFNIVELTANQANTNVLSADTLFLDKVSRDKVRNSAQQVLALIDQGESA